MHSKKKNKTKCWKFYFYFLSLSYFMYRNKASINYLSAKEKSYRFTSTRHSKVRKDYTRNFPFDFPRTERKKQYGTL